MQITETSKALFFAYAADAGNWGGEPLVGGNVGGSKEERGNLTQLKRVGLVVTFKYEGLMYVRFTPAGVAFASENNIKISQY